MTNTISDTGQLVGETNAAPAGKKRRRQEKETSSSSSSSSSSSFGSSSGSSSGDNEGPQKHKVHARNGILQHAKLPRAFRAVSVGNGQVDPVDLAAFQFSAPLVVAGPHTFRDGSPASSSAPEDPDSLPL